MAKVKKKIPNLVCLRYIPQGENAEIKIYIDVKKIPSGRHHYRPSSRRGQTVIDIDKTAHWAWHILFGNDFIEEVIAKIIYAWRDKRGQIKEEYLLGRIKEDEMGTKYDERLLAWYIIFGECRDADEAVKIIKDKFTKRA